MSTTRSYGDACGIARALDAVGERWALLVVRELLLGPQRFTELRRALPGASSNLLSDRLRELEGREVLRRRRLAAPASSWVYELTERGRELEPIVLALGGWGLGFPPPTEPTLSATSVMLFLRGAARPDPDAPATVCRIELDDRVWTVRVAGGQVRVDLGEIADPDAGLRTDPKTLNAVLDDLSALDAALDDGSAVVTGDPAVLRRLLRVS
ncbi:winged helix-turn-helix transcriptional regulator [Herbidospora mongoliensis]|uniref:winged helix-turn-helix transcriptional regulator n=1 Tax=Herbidospora mongoliensis TaxID=688067 RepID=UPI000834C9ED|nr:winged helix-turn-helix transcriptional regulator [Herbidospora mongoliensis]